MAEQLTLEQLEEQVAQLPPQEQLTLVAYISERLSGLLPATLPSSDDAEELEQRQQEVDALLALCDAAAEQWEGEFDSAEDIRQMRQARDEQIWPSK